MEWLISHGAKFNKVKLKQFNPNYRGVIATEDIKMDEVLVFIPLECMITLKRIQELELGKKLNNENLRHPSNSTLAAYLLKERLNPDSQWKYLIESMPDSVDNFPIFFTSKEKSLLNGTQFLRKFPYMNSKN